MLKSKGYTLLEMLLVLAILAVLFSLVIFNVRPVNILNDTKTSKAEVDTSIIKTALDSYKAFKGTLPTSFSSKSQGEYEICTYGALACPAWAISLDELVDQKLILNIPVIDDTDPNLTGYKVIYDGTAVGDLSVVVSNEIISEVTPTSPEVTLTPPAATTTPVQPTPTPQLLALGDDYQGGKVAYFFQPGDVGYIEGENHGLITSTTDLGVPSTWSTAAIATDASSTTIGTGDDNTARIVTVMGIGSYCAKNAYDLDLNGYTDWYMPNLGELEAIKANQSIIGTFDGWSSYWTSSESGIWSFRTTSAWNVSMYPSQGANQAYKMNFSFRCRPIRKF